MFPLVERTTAMAGNKVAAETEAVTFTPKEAMAITQVKDTVKLGRIVPGNVYRVVSRLYQINEPLEGDNLFKEMAAKDDINAKRADVIDLVKMDSSKVSLAASNVSYYTYWDKDVPQEEQFVKFTKEYQNAVVGGSYTGGYSGLLSGPLNEDQVDQIVKRTEVSDTIETAIDLKGYKLLPGKRYAITQDVISLGAENMYPEDFTKRGLPNPPNPDKSRNNLLPNRDKEYLEAFGLSPIEDENEYPIMQGDMPLPTVAPLPVGMCAPFDVPHMSLYIPEQQIVISDKESEVTPPPSNTHKTHKHGGSVSKRNNPPKPKDKEDVPPAPPTPSTPSTPQGTNTVHADNDSALEDAMASANSGLSGIGNRPSTQEKSVPKTGTDSKGGILAGILAALSIAIFRRKEEKPEE